MDKVTATPKHAIIYIYVLWHVIVVLGSFIVILWWL